MRGRKAVYFRLHIAGISIKQKRLRCSAILYDFTILKWNDTLNNWTFLTVYDKIQLMESTRGFFALSVTDEREGDHHRFRADTNEG